MEIIKCSIEPLDNWNKLDFQEFTKVIRDKKYIGTGFEYEMWIITKSEDTTYVNMIANTLNIPEERVIYCGSDNLKVFEISKNNIDIHLDAEQSVVVNLDVLSNNTNKIWGISVDNKLDYAAMGRLYITHFGKYTEIILRERRDNGIQEKNC